MILRTIFISFLHLKLSSSFSTCNHISLTPAATTGRRSSSLASTFSPLWVKFNMTRDESPSRTSISDKSIHDGTEINGSNLSELDFNGQQETNTIVGIGGKDGFVYDINKLKRNRIQESLKTYKEELLQLLATLDIESVSSQRKQHLANTHASNDELTIGELDALEKFNFLDKKILELVQINPVSTTTDSNLLDGEWTFAYASEGAARKLDEFILAPSLKEERTSKATKRLSKRSKAPNSSVDAGPGIIKHHVGEPWKIKKSTEGVFRTSTRDVHLEDLDDSEDPYIIDQTRILGGMLMFEMRYDVMHLTRKTLHVCPTEYNVYFFSKWKWIRSPRMVDGQIQVLYLDSDVCICRPMPESKEVDVPLFLYTKKEIWVGKKERANRKIQLLRKIPKFLKLQIKNRINKKREENAMKDVINDHSQKQTVLVKKKNPSSTVSMLKIGEVTSESEPGWSVDDDPFAHLSLGERNEIMKKMSLEDIEKAGLRQREKAKKQRERKYKAPKKIKRPESL